MASNYPPMDTSRSAEERQAARAQQALDKLTAAKKAKSKDELQLEQEGGNLLGIIPSFISLVSDTVKEVPKFLANHDPLSVIHAIGHSLDNGSIDWSAAWDSELGFLKGEPSSLHKGVDTAVSNFVEFFFKQSLGIDLGENSGGTYKAGTINGISREVDASSAINTVNQLAQFLIAVPFVVAGINFVGKSFLGERWSESAGEYLHKLVEELGLNWMMGGLLENIFEQATGRELEELINLQKMPNRLDMMTLRTLARQHKIDPIDFDWELHKLGYPSEARKLILELDTQQLPIGDIATAWLQGYKDKPWVAQYLKKQGYSDEDVDVLLFTYINHVTSSADTQYRAIARNLYVEGKISENQYRTYMGIANTPERTIDTEVASANLQLEYGRQTLTISVIKTLWNAGQYNDEEARAHLKDLGYNDTDASDLIVSWNKNTTTKPKQLSASQILRYMIEGAISKKDAYNKLIELHYRPQDAQFLVDNPSAQTNTDKYGLKPATIISAYIDGVITQDLAIAGLQQLGVNAQEAVLEISIANYRIAKAKKTTATPKEIGRGDIKEAFDLGRIYELEAESMLEKIGYTPDDARFIAMNWFIKLHPADVSNPSAGGFVPSPLFEPNNYTPPASLDEYNLYYILRFGIYYAVYPAVANNFVPPNSVEYVDTDGSHYYILINSPVPPSFSRP